MTADLTDRTLRQGRALVRATEALGTIERAPARLLRGIVEVGGGVD